MGHITCPNRGCRSGYSINIFGAGFKNRGVRTKLTGVLRCSCGYATPLEATATLAGIGWGGIGDSEVKTREAAPEFPSTDIPEVDDAYAEARLAFYGGAHRATVAFCRTAGEELLKHKGFNQRSFDAQIQAAKAANLIDDESEMLAHGARLIGRNALHRNRAVSMSQALIALQATVDFVTEVLPKQPPATQSRSGSNAP